MSTALILFGPNHPPAAAEARLSELTGGSAISHSGSWGWSVRTLVDEVDETSRAAVAAMATELGCDHAIVTGRLATELPRLVVMDVDSTVTTTEAIDLLADQAGAGDQVAAITEAAMRGELDFVASLQARVATLAGLEPEQVSRARQGVELQPGAVEWGQWAAHHGIDIALLSGGFTSFVEPVATAVGATSFRANTLDIDATGRLTGTVVGEVIDRAAKATHLHRLAAEMGIDEAQVVAVGDGANDLDMLAAAGVGVAYCAKPVTAAQADVAITFNRLDAVIAVLAPPTA